MVERKNNLLLGLATNFLKMSIGFITYPVYLRYLESFQLSIFFLFSGTGALLELLDFGFSGNITRYFAYAASGVSEVIKTRIPADISLSFSSETNLTNNLMQFAKIYYRVLCGIALLLVIGGFSIYLYFFAKLHNAAYGYIEGIWLIYSVGTLFSVYYMYLAPLLIGKGFIDKTNKIALFCRILGAITQIIMLFSGLGLVSIAIGAVVSGITERILLLKLVRQVLGKVNTKISKPEFWQLFYNLWHTNYKLGLITLAWLFIAKINTFIAGFAIHDIKLLSEYLFTFQVITILLTFAHVPLSNNFADIAAYYVQDRKKGITLFLKANSKSLWLMLLLSIGMLSFGNLFLKVLHFKHGILTNNYLIIILIIYIFEKQLINHTTMITVRNEVPMFKAYLLTAACVFSLTLIFAYAFKLGIWAVILPQLIVQGLFNYWYWVKYNLAQDEISLYQYGRSLLRII